MPQLFQTFSLQISVSNELKSHSNLAVQGWVSISVEMIVQEEVFELLQALGPENWPHDCLDFGDLFTEWATFLHQIVFYTYMDSKYICSA